jgi:hypothetical protein
MDDPTAIVYPCIMSRLDQDSPWKDILREYFQEATT